jgi:type IV fimbrial biogenesis protein FimT
MPDLISHRPDARQFSATTRPGAAGRQHGCSMIEALCGLAIMLVLLANAWPMLQDLVSRQSLLAQASSLETDLALARAQAYVQQQNLRFSVHQPADGGSCYIIHSGAAGACRCHSQGQPICDAGAQVVRVAALSQGVRLAPLSRPLTFDAMMGTVTPTATLRLSDPDGRTVHQVINLTGRVRTCTPNPAWGGMRRC